MNFLSHFFLDKDHRSAHFLFGVALPDLLGNYNRSFKIRQHYTLLEFEDDILSEINEGVKKHLEVDAIFHVSEHFLKHNEFILSLLKKEKFQTLKRFHFAVSHILFELMLDRMLMRKFPEICSQFYSSLETVEEKKIENYFKNINFVNQPFEWNNFSAYFNRFKQVKYLEGYVDNESLIFSLNRIFLKVNRQNFSEGDRVILNEIIKVTDNYLSEQFLEIFNEFNCQV